MELDSEHNCLKCKYFISFADYYEDEYEDTDYGHCSNLDSEYCLSGGCNIEMICDLFTRFSGE